MVTKLETVTKMQFQQRKMVDLDIPVEVYSLRCGCWVVVVDI